MNGPQVSRPQAPYGARTTAQRVGMLLGVLVIEGIGFGISLGGFMPASADGASGSDYWGPLAASAALAFACLLAVHLVAFAFLAPFVSYRWFDTFFLLVPVVSVVFWFRVVWRITALPERPWPPRDSELPPPPRRVVTEDDFDSLPGSAGSADRDNRTSR